MRKIAIPIVSERLSAHFGHCEKFGVFHLDGNNIVKEEMLLPPNHAPGVLPDWLAKHGVTDVITGGMGQQAINIFRNNNIQVTLGARESHYREVLKQFMENRLEVGDNKCDHEKSLS
jgi:predicted Fe-Mo cluster-binding NifX family protein